MPYRSRQPSEWGKRFRGFSFWKIKPVIINHNKICVISVPFISHKYANNSDSLPLTPLRRRWKPSEISLNLVYLSVWRFFRRGGFRSAPFRMTKNRLYKVFLKFKLAIPTWQESSYGRPTYYSILLSANICRKEGLPH